ncbi:uncharacterized protein [Drosophila tropicalis]|uniref:uncharacterized protein n=1 Tax=Drosophila tropicalis TaxID=46794 RepID=UPI0035ABE918
MSKNKEVPHLKASLTSFRQRSALLKSPAIKSPKDKRNGLDPLSDEKETTTVSAIKKFVHWDLPLGFSSSPVVVKHSNSKLKSSSQQKSIFVHNQTTKPQFEIDSPSESKNSNEKQLAHELRMAVHHGGGSCDPEQNLLLRAKLSPLQLPYSLVQRILRECELSERNQATHFLFIDCIGQQLSLVCKVRTDNLNETKERLLNVLHAHRASFSHHKLFKEFGLIDCFLPKYTPLNSEDFAHTLQTDALWCKALSAEITNDDCGSVRFKCKSNDTTEVVAKLKDCGYKIIHAEQGYCPKGDLVKLSHSKLKRYEEFLKALHNDPDVVHVYDNLQTQKNDRKK